MSNVVAFKDGQPIMDRREQSEAVVKYLAGLLDQASSGEVVGIAIACEYHDQTTTYHHHGRVSRATTGALMELVSELGK